MINKKDSNRKEAILSLYSDLNAQGGKAYLRPTRKENLDKTIISKGSYWDEYYDYYREEYERLDYTITYNYKGE